MFEISLMPLNKKEEIDFMLPHCCSKRSQSKLLMKLTQFFCPMRSTFKLITVGILLFLIVDGCSAEFKEVKIQVLSQYKLTARASEGGSVYPKEGFYKRGATLTMVSNRENLAFFRAKSD